MEPYAFHLLGQAVEIWLAVDMPVNAVRHAMGFHDFQHFCRLSLLIKGGVMENGKNFLTIKFFRFYERTF